jgi:DNA polymerase-1
MLMSYCLAGGLHAHGLDFLAMRHFGHAMISFAQVTGSGKNQKNFSEIAIEPATQYAAEDADFTLRLYEALSPQLAAQGVQRIYDTVERPLVPVIARMEAAGIAIDVPALQRLSAEFGTMLAGLEEEIIALAGMPFSVASPKQLGEVLFDKLQLPGGKKSAKSGAYTTDAATLETLAEQGHAIARKLLEWRHYSKLKSTYTDALPKAISPRDGRVHTHYSMVGASTGRLSSSDPNLQNIPIRSDEGKRIRETFVAPVGSQLISADYSQIELRLLAHMADIPVLKEAFKNGADIHAVTASEMFGVPLDQVTSELRRRAKSINFGIIYGISAHGLSVQLGISRADAADYIAKYFAQYPGIREYMDRTVEFARAHGYVETLYGRRVHVRDINSKNGALRQFSERAAINAPLQGTAADIIKKAMVAVEEVVAGHQSPVASEENGARLLLQVHDELIIEAPTEQCVALIPRIKKAMEQVASLSVPLTVEVGVGQHWGAAH